MGYPPWPGIGYSWPGQDRGVPQDRVPPARDGVPPGKDMGTHQGWNTPLGMEMGYPPPRQIGQQRKHLLHGGQYASCVHTGGLSCFLT